jgi:hypothetical protein
MQLLQQNINNTSDFVKVNDRSLATHYIDDADGLIKDLTTNLPVSNKPVSNKAQANANSEEPLVAPTINFGDEQKEVNNESSAEQPLTVPTMNFEN